MGQEGSGSGDGGPPAKGPEVRTEVFRARRGVAEKWRGAKDPDGRAPGAPLQPLVLPPVAPPVAPPPPEAPPPPVLELPVRVASPVPLVEPSVEAPSPSIKPSVEVSQADGEAPRSEHDAGPAPTLDRPPPHRRSAVRVGATLVAFALGGSATTALWLWSRGPGSNAVCAPTAAFLPDPTPVIDIDRRPGAAWRNAMVACVDAFETPDGEQAAWFRYRNLDGTSGIGRATHQGGTWTVDRDPTLTSEGLAPWGVEEIGCTTTLVEDGRVTVWFRADLPGKNRVIFEAVSEDGRNLVVSATNPVLRDDTTEHGGLWAPSILHDGDIYRLYVRCGGAGRSSICMATSSDGHRWQREDGDVIKNYRARMGNSLGAPHVVKEGDRYELFFEHKWYPELGDASVTPFTAMRSEIAVITSKKPDSFNARKANVLLSAGAAPWMSEVVDHPFFTYEDGAPVLYFRGSGPAGALEGSIGRALGTCGDPLDENPERRLLQGLDVHD